MPTFGRYEPRRRALTAREQRSVAVAQSRGQHRQAVHHSRIGLLAATSCLTVLVAIGSLAILSTVTNPPASADVVSTAAISTARIDPVVVPAKENPAESALAESAQPAVDAIESEALPEDSGTGKRVVFSPAAQRVWLVNADESVNRTYEASGSIVDNLRAGSYQVQSKFRNATSYDYGSTMQYFVRFTTGQNAPIGFHDIPIGSDGAMLQTVDQLGTPLSAGCIRQARPDAIKLWNFAPVGTPVEVLD